MYGSFEGDDSPYPSFDEFTTPVQPVSPQPGADPSAYATGMPTGYPGYPGVAQTGTPAGYPAGFPGGFPSAVTGAPVGQPGYTTSQPTASAGVSQPAPSGSTTLAGLTMLGLLAAGVGGYSQLGIGGAAAGIALGAGVANIVRAPSASDPSPQAASERLSAFVAAAVDLSLGAWIAYHLYTDHQRGSR